MARVTPTGRPVRRRLGLLLISVVLLLAVAGCGDDDSVFTTNPDGSPTASSTLPGGLGGDDNQGNGSGTGSNPGASAAGIPANAQVYAAFDLTAFPQLMQMVQAFGEIDPSALTEGLGDTGGQAIEGAEEAQNLLSCLSDSLGIETGGLPAWIGGEAAIGLFNMQFDAASGDMSDANALVTVEVADQAAAAAALPGIITSVATCSGVTFTESDHNGVTVYGAASPDGTLPTSLALTEGYLMYGEGAGMVEQAIDLGDGASLADDANFAEVLAALPDGRHLTGYLAAGLIEEAMGSLTASLGESGGLTLPAGLDPTEMMAGMRGLGLSATILEEGVRLEMVTVGEPNETLPTGVAGAGDMAGMLPADAIGFAGIGAFDVPAAWGSLMEILAQMPVEEGGHERQRHHDHGRDDARHRHRSRPGRPTHRGDGPGPAARHRRQPGDGIRDQPGHHRRVGRAGLGRHGHHRPGSGHRPRRPAGAPATPRPFEGGTLLRPLRRHQRHRPLRHGRGPHGDHHPREPRRRPPGRGRPAGRVGPLRRGHQRPARGQRPDLCTSTSPPWSAL